MNKPIVLIDCDDTILDFGWAERRALTKALRTQHLDVSERFLQRYSEINRSWWEKLERGEVTRREVMIGRFEETFAEFGISHVSGEETEKLYEENLCEGHCFVPGAPEMLEALSGKVRLFLISNGSSRIQNARLKSAGIIPYFEGIFISEQIGAEKPSVAFFDFCLSRIPDFRAEDAVVVGDSLTSDILGGINAGLRTVWLNRRGGSPKEGMHPDFEICSPSELPALLDKLFSL